MVARQCSVEAYCAAVSDGIAGTYSSSCGIMFPALCAVYTREITIQRSIAVLLNAKLARKELFNGNCIGLMPRNRKKNVGKEMPLNFHLVLKSFFSSSFFSPPLINNRSTILYHLLKF